jgi:hypothetical protein
LSFRGAQRRGISSDFAPLPAVDSCAQFPSFAPSRLQIIQIIHAEGIPQLRIPHPAGGGIRNDSGKRGIPRSTPACHPEERSDEGSLETCNHFPPYSQLQIPHYVRNDSGKRGIPRSAFLSSREALATRDLLAFVTTSRRIPNYRFLTYVRNDSGKRGIPRSAPACHSEERSDEESPRILHRFPL